MDIIATKVKSDLVVKLAKSGEYSTELIVPFKKFLKKTGFPWDQYDFILTAREFAALLPEDEKIPSEIITNDILDTNWFTFMAGTSQLTVFFKKEEPNDTSHNDFTIQRVNELKERFKSPNNQYNLDIFLQEMLRDGLADYIPLFMKAIMTDTEANKKAVEGYNPKIKSAEDLDKQLIMQKDIININITRYDLARVLTDNTVDLINDAITDFGIEEVSKLLQRYIDEAKRYIKMKTLDEIRDKLALEVFFK